MLTSVSVKKTGLISGGGQQAISSISVLVSIPIRLALLLCGGFQQGGAPFLHQIAGSIPQNCACQKVAAAYSSLIAFHTITWSCHIMITLKMQIRTCCISCGRTEAADT